MKVFIVSTGRTGTGFFGKTLNQIPGVRAFHEPEPDMIKEGKRFIKWKHKTFKHMTIRNRFPFHLYYRLKFKWSRWLNALSGDQDIYLEASSKLVPIMPLIRQAFPDCVLIQVVRHPGSFVRSALNMGWFFQNSRGKLPLLPTYFGEMSWKEWNHCTPLQRANWFWLKCNRRIMNAEPDLLLSFRSIFEAPHSGFKQLLQELNLTVDRPEKLLSKNVGSSFDLGLPPYEDWDQEWKDAIKESVDWYERYFPAQAGVNDT